MFDFTGSSTSSVTTGTITTPDLREWTQFWVYAVCEDKDGNLSRASSGGVYHADKTQMIGNYAYDGAAGDGDSRTWDYQYPTVSSLGVSLLTDNTVRLTYVADDSADSLVDPETEPNSGLARIYVYYTTTDASYSVDDVVANASSNLAQGQSYGGHVWDLTATYPDNSSSSDTAYPYN